MKWLNCSQIVIVLAGFVVAVVLGGGSANADFTFGEPVLFDEPVNSTGFEFFECISADGLEVYVERPVEDRIDCPVWDFYVSTRATTSDPWSVPTKLGPPVNSDYDEGFACLSGDGLELYFTSTRPGGHGGRDLWVATRPTVSAPWATAVNLGPTINTAGLDTTPWITRDGLELYFSSDRPGGYGRVDIWVATRVTTNDAWGEPANLGPPVNSEAGDYFPCPSSDGLVLFLSDYHNLNQGMRSGGKGLSDMWMTRRKSTADPWGPPIDLGKGMNTNCWDTQPRLSPDGSVLYFTSSRPDSRVWATIEDIWQAPIIPIVDFNSDGIVDAADMCIMVDHWGEDYSLCDIGPMPWGDGIVDVEDMKILAEHLFTYPGTMVYWKLDEKEGDIAYDSASSYDGILMGDPVWQPNAGMVAGALQFDGIDDHVITSFILNPAEGPFSVFAWIEGGAAGQVILSQEGGVNWLMADTVDGALQTDLRTPATAGRYPKPPGPPLICSTVVADGNWHRVGFVRDGINRILYVDDVEVARDTAINLEVADGGLYIGAGSDLEPVTFWAGLIDDVRIYDVALSAEQITALAQ